MSPTEASAIDSPFRTVAAARSAVDGVSALAPRPKDDAGEFMALGHAQHPATDRSMWQQHSAAAAAAADADLLRRLDYGMHAMTPELRAFSSGAAFGALRPPSVPPHEHSSETFSRNSAETIDAIVPHLMERAERRRLRRLAEESGAAAATQSLLESSHTGVPPGHHLTAQVLRMVQHGEGQSAAFAAGLPAAASPELGGQWVAQTPPQTVSASSSWASGHHNPVDHGDSGSTAAPARSVGSEPRSRLAEAGASTLDRSSVPSPATSSAPLLNPLAVSTSGPPASSVRRLSLEGRQPLALQSGDEAAQQRRQWWPAGGALHMVRAFFFF